MGSYQATCAISGLPIAAGEDIRILLLVENPYEDKPVSSHGVWYPRTFPLKAKYNDYGSAEDVEEGAARDIWLEGLKLDLVETGWGDNTCHDVPTSKTMTFEQLLNALQEGRVRVRRYDGNVVMDSIRQALRQAHVELRDHAKEAGATSSILDLIDGRPPKSKTAAGVPTRRRVENALKAAGFPLYGGARKGHEGGYLVNKVRYGCVRVRFQSWTQETFGKDAEFLTKIQTVLDAYSTVIVAGEGSYANAADLLVFVKPGTEGYHRSRRERAKSQKVVLAMIREDVWQALLTLSVPDWDGRNETIEVYHKDLATYTAEYDKIVAENKAAGTEHLTSTELYGLVHDIGHKNHLASVVGRDVIPFSVGLGTHWDLMRMRGSIPPSFMQTAVEFAFVGAVLHRTRYYWRPGYCIGPQFGKWGMHVKTLKALTDVARRGLKKDRRNNTV